MMPARDARHAVLRAVPGEAAAVHRAHPAHDHHADHLRAVHGRLVRHREPRCSTSTSCCSSASLAFFLRRRNYPIPPFVLGLVLGDILDKSLRRGLDAVRRRACCRSSRARSARCCSRSPCSRCSCTSRRSTAPSTRLGGNLARRFRRRHHGHDHENDSPRHHHERRHRTHGHEPASRALDQRDPRAGRRRARRRARASCPIRSSSAATRTRSRRSRRRTAIARWTTDLDAALADRDESRSTSTPRRPACGPKLVRKAIAAGKHIYCEKPIAPTLAEALDLYRARRGGGRASTASCRTSSGCRAC